MILCNITFCVTSECEEQFLAWTDRYFFESPTSIISGSSRPMLSKVLLPQDMIEKEMGDDTSYAFQWLADSEEVARKWFEGCFNDAYGELCLTVGGPVPFFVTMLNVQRCR